MLVDYKTENFCTYCRIKLRKDQIRCTECNWLVRTKPISTLKSEVVRY